MTETYAISMANGSGVERRPPATPARTIRSLLPLSWFRREIEVTTTAGETLSGQLLDCCPTGPIILCRLGRSEATRRVISWDAVLYVDLAEGK